MESDRRMVTQAKGSMQKVYRRLEQGVVTQQLELKCN